MEDKTNLESEIKQWLETALKSENLKDLSVKIVGNSEKGDGYLGDIVFVDVSGIAEDGSEKEYSLALKCSKRSEKLRAQYGLKEIFLKEICIYEQIIPTFAQFEKEKRIENYFDSVPKYYGKFTNDSMEVIVLQNLKKRGYDLWDRRKPITREHINLVTSKYGQFHAISVAMREQQPERFEALRKLITEVFDEAEDETTEEMYKMFEGAIDEVYDLLQNDLDEDTRQKWVALKQQVKPCFERIEANTSVKVISHGDCWNSNFMYLCDNDKKEFPNKVAILDWQASRFASPVGDLSEFIFACTSEEDLSNLEVFLEHYYKCFADHLEKLGSQPSVIYPYEVFLRDWNKCGKYGIVVASLIHKVCTTEKEEIIDLAESVEEGKSMLSSFQYKIKNKENFKKRILPIVKYFVEHEHDFM